MTRQIAFLIYPGFNLLDVTGPISAFNLACRNDPDAYVIQLVAVGGGPIASSAGIAFDTLPLGDLQSDTIIVAGGELQEDDAVSAEMVQWLRNQSPHARRTASVSVGAFLLAEAGLLNGRRATTHWGVTHIFARRFPDISLDADRIYIRDEGIWTSGGASAGIDLALAMIEDDLGAATARHIAQLLVVHQRRPGGQSQHSALLDQGGVSGRFAGLMAWVQDHLDERLSVEDLAAQVAMSPRHFARAFTAEVGLTPAKTIEKFRVDRARASIEASHLSVDAVAKQCGFGDSERMRRAFLRCFGLPPQVFRQSARTARTIAARGQLMALDNGNMPDR